MKMVMNLDEVKRQMMELWEKVFHDSKPYINLIFDNYFDERFIEYEEVNGKIIASLMGIPYRFTNGEDNVKALYLCGLATDAEHRHKGIMTKLLNRINERLKNEFVFSFLIPSSGQNSYYYHKRGYHNAIFRLEQCFTSVHDFHNDFLLSISDPNDKARVLKEALYDSITVEKYQKEDKEDKKIIDFISQQEKERHSYLFVNHDSKDIEVIINENGISGNEIFISKDKDSNITGVAFISKNSVERIYVTKIYNRDQSSYFKLLDYIKRHYAIFSLSIFQYPDDSERFALWDEVSSVPNPEGDNLEALYSKELRTINIRNLSQPYGMIHILDYSKIFEYIAKTRNDLRFSITLRRNNGQLIQFNVNKGTVSVTEQQNIEESKKNKTVLNENELTNIIFRKPDNSRLIMEAFGIPRIGVNISLMLD